ncbi:hypothetical protein HHK36_020941 [Tetracentron sinense]|uniref:Coenzyme Q-binding protein COQ10 START domain-containing protein n=1 Tax=Tetracentron sinense TaxID=13715 RepID=A0A834YSM1_TETSI|nr:hypothetical protein HHK36_020941 [Tetracentron sinense]
MSATPAFVCGPTSLLNHFRRTRNGILFNAIPIYRRTSRSSPTELFFRNSVKRKSIFTRTTPISPVMEWQDCTVKMEIDVPCSVAYNCYSDREAMPRWMPFISSVKVFKAFRFVIVEVFLVLLPDNHAGDKPDLSCWSLKYKVFGRDIELSWIAKNLQPIPNKKIHWRSLEGLPNRHCNPSLKAHSCAGWNNSQRWRKAIKQNCLAKELNWVPKAS